MHGRSDVLHADTARRRRASGARRAAAIAVVLASAGLLVASVAADAAKPPPKPKKWPLPKPKKARFSVTVKGKQVTAWVTNYQGADRCEASVSGGGAESWRFETVKANVTVIDTGLGAPHVLLESDPMDGLLAVAKVTRSGSLTATPVPPDCAAGGGDGCGGPDCPPPPPPDCGTKWNMAHPMDLDFGPDGVPDRKAKELLILRSMVGRIVDLLRHPSGDIFKNCVRGGDSYPHLIDSDTAGRPIAAKLPSKQLFDRRQPTIKVKAEGKRYREFFRGHSATTTLSWEATFKRLGRRR